ncbi:tyrosine-type recombinase/integrase [Bacillus sp. FJAT-49705]|uniref:Tyrosine-type recombinase/integrase n=1 Tax=Cytobacillus citreus TaxID=2833586 RepID=A0ABS5NWE2_9BACI|nr:tyrosine-type recombinase/integrase [Cytobacillus citreus]MBS4191759.1 tyrosine-type recombinase/integrase [Cytobacillus citreus]
MNIVQPIRDAELIQEIKEFLKNWNERNYILFLLGINTGLRIKDILKLRVSDVEGWSIFLKEGKTGKLTEIHMPNELKRALRSYIKGKDKNEYLFKSREGKNKPITVSMAYVIMKNIEEEFGLERIGCHSLRKTYGYHHYKQFNDVVALMEHFNHSDPKITLIYIGMKQDEKNKYQKKFKI